MLTNKKAVISRVKYIMTAMGVYKPCKCMFKHHFTIISYKELSRMATQKKVAIFGDSYVTRLSRYCEGDLKVPVATRFYGKGGMTVDKYNEDLFKRMTDDRPTTVLLCLGGNDISSTSRPQKIAERIIGLAARLRAYGVENVVFIEITERGKFRKDRHLTKKIFNSQRRKINELVRRSEETLVLDTLFYL